MTVEDLKLDTVIYKEDHLNDFSKKNNRLDFNAFKMYKDNIVGLFSS
ncbi:hypothetical protein ACIQD3_19780 [Peribacillus loiseleuriae]